MTLNGMKELRQEEINYLREFDEQAKREGKNIQDLTYEERNQIAELVECIQCIEAFVVYHLAPSDVLKDPARLLYCANKLRANPDLKYYAQFVLIFCSYNFTLDRFKNTWHNMAAKYGL